MYFFFSSFQIIILVKSLKVSEKHDLNQQEASNTFRSEGQYEEIKEYMFV